MDMNKQHFHPKCFIDRSAPLRLGSSRFGRGHGWRHRAWKGDSLRSTTFSEWIIRAGARRQVYKFALTEFVFQILRNASQVQSGQSGTPTLDQALACQFFAMVFLPGGAAIV